MPDHVTKVINTFSNSFKLEVSEFVQLSFKCVVSLEPRLQDSRVIVASKSKPDSWAKTKQ